MFRIARRVRLPPAVAIVAVIAVACSAQPATGAAGAAGTAGALLVTALALGVRHGIDWDHIAAIVDITSTTAAAEAAEEEHAEHHAVLSGHVHPHGGPAELAAHRAGAVGPHQHANELTRSRFLSEQGRAVLLGTLYALGHAFVVAVLGIAALMFGALLPNWVDPIMGRVVGVTLIVLGAWVFFSLYQYARHGHEFRLRSRWMLVFDSVRYGWRRLLTSTLSQSSTRSISSAAKVCFRAPYWSGVRRTGSALAGPDDAGPRSAPCKRSTRTVGGSPLTLARGDDIRLDRGAVRDVVEHRRCALGRAPDLVERLG